MMESVISITATKTDDSELTNDRPETLSVAQAIEYLAASPRHALVITDLDEESGECVALDPVYVMRGADDETMYYGPFPAEDPNDATWAGSIEQALSNALDMLCTG